jgi:cytochrome c553
MRRMVSITLAAVAFSCAIQAEDKVEPLVLEPLTRHERLERDRMKFEALQERHRLERPHLMEPIQPDESPAYIQSLEAAAQARLQPQAERQWEETQADLADRQERKTKMQVQTETLPEREVWELYRLIEEQVKETPEQILVVGAGHSEYQLYERWRLINKETKWAIRRKLKNEDLQRLAEWEAEIRAKEEEKRYGAQRPPEERGTGLPERPKP